MGSPLFACTTYNGDNSLDSQVTYRIDPHIPEFAMNSTTGEVTLAWQLDVLRTHNYTISVVAENHAGPPLSTTVLVQFYVIGTNAHTPAFVPSSHYTFSVPENSPPTTLVGQVAAVDPDENLDGTVRFSIVNGSNGAMDLVGIDAVTGVLSLLAYPDFEVMQEYTLWVKVSDLGTPVSRSSLGVVTINILDLNDNSPVFSTSEYTAYLMEDQSNLLLAAQVQATDVDSGINGTAGIRFSFGSNGTDARFALDPVTGDLLATAPVYYTSQSHEIRITVIATDRLGASDGFSRSGSAEVVIYIVPRNLHSPVFTTHQFSAVVDEFASVGTFVGITGLAVDADVGGGFGNVSYRVLEPTNTFAVEQYTGRIYLNGALDWNTRSRYVFQIIAQDVDSRYDVALVSINITYNLMHPTPVFVQSVYSTSIYEDRPFGFELPIVPHAVDVVNRLDYAFQYYISEADTPWFSINSVTGNITVIDTVNRELIPAANNDVVSLTISALYQPNGRIATCIVRITVLDVNEYAPTFSTSTYSFSVLENITAGTVVGIVSATDLDSGINALITFSMTPVTVPFNINPQSGVITTTGLISREVMAMYNLTIKATDGGGLNSTATVLVTLIDVNNNAPQVTDVVAPFGSVSIGRAPINGWINTVTLQDFPETYCTHVTPCSDSRTVLALSATDADSGLNGQVQYRIVVNDLTLTPLAIDQQVGRLYLTGELDRERVANFTFQVVAYDLGTPPQQTIIEVTVFVLDLNDNIPYIQPPATTTIVLSEAAIGGPLALITGIDNDATAGNNRAMEYLVRPYVAPGVSAVSTNTFYFATSSSGVMTDTGVVRILMYSHIAYNYSQNATQNLYSMNITARNSLGVPVLTSPPVQLNVQVVPLIGNTSTVDATKIQFDWRAPLICSGNSNTSIADCSLPLKYRRSTPTSYVELWTLRSYDCTLAQCLNMVTNPATPSSCECLLYGPSAPSYDATAQSFVLEGIKSGTAGQYQLRVFQNGQQQYVTPWMTKVVQSFTPSALTLTQVGTATFSASWVASPQPNGALVGYRVCYCLVSRVPSSSCTCSGVLGSDAVSSPENGYTTRTTAYLPDPSTSTVLARNTTYTAVVELVTLLDNNQLSIAQSTPVQFTTGFDPVSTSASTAALSDGGIAGVVIGVIACMVIVLAIVVIVIRRNRRNQTEQGQSSSNIEELVAHNINRTGVSLNHGSLLFQQTSFGNDVNSSTMHDGNGNNNNSNTKQSQLANQQPLTVGGSYHYYTQERSEQFLGGSHNSMALSEPETMEMSSFLADPSLSSSVVDHPNTYNNNNNNNNNARNNNTRNTNDNNTSDLNQSQKSSGLPSMHVMGGEQLGALIPRTNSRSSPFLNRYRLNSTASNTGVDMQDQLFHGQLRSLSTFVFDDTLSARVARLKASGDLDSEFARVNEGSAGHVHQYVAAKESFNIHKNRYRNILPPDQTRVRLVHTGAPGSDYINANYIEGWRNKKSFIATQGPLPATVQDFWRMIWQENCGVIINATQLEEDGKVKCHKYWPEDSATLEVGPLEVSMVEILSKPSYTRRLLSLRNLQTNQERVVNHFTFDAWPDHGVPASAEAVLQLLQESRQAHDEATRMGVDGPMVIHCSAGVGRTGVLCGIDICLQRAKEIGHFDVPATVLHMRCDRPGSVQTVMQYGFIYDAVLMAYQQAHAATIPSQQAKDKELYVPTPPPAHSQQVKPARNSMSTNTRATDSTVPQSKPAAVTAAVVTAAVTEIAVTASAPVVVPTPVPVRVPQIPAATAASVVAPPVVRPSTSLEPTSEPTGPLSMNELSILSELGGRDGPTDSAELVRLLKALE